MNGGYIALIVIGSLLVIFFAVVFSLLPVKTYFTALFSGCHISCRRLITMRFRKLPVFDLVNAYITARKANLGLSLVQIENIYSSNENYNALIEGMIVAKSAGLNYNMETIQKLVFAGRNIRDFVGEVLTSRVMDTEWITGVCGDLQEINAKMRVTLAVNKKNIFSTIDESTIIARVNESVLSKICSAKDHRTIMQNPEVLARAVYEADADNGNFYELVSVDVVELTLGNDLSARKERDLLEKQRIIEQNKLETALKTINPVINKTKAEKTDTINKQVVDIIFDTDKNEQLETICEVAKEFYPEDLNPNTYLLMIWYMSKCKLRDKAEISFLRYRDEIIRINEMLDKIDQEEQKVEKVMLKK